MVIKCLCFDGVKNSENCTFRFRKLYVSFSRLYNLAFVLNDACCSISEEHDIRDKKKQIVSIFFHGIKDLC